MGKLQNTAGHPDGPQTSKAPNVSNTHYDPCYDVTSKRIAKDDSPVNKLEQLSRSINKEIRGDKVYDDRKIDRMMTDYQMKSKWGDPAMVSNEDMSEYESDLRAFNRWKAQGDVFKKKTEGMHDMIDDYRESSTSYGTGPALHATPEGMKTSGVKFDDEKVAFHLLPPLAMEGTAWIFKYGGVKYAAWNHSKGMPWSKQYRAALGHMMEIGMGNHIDDESGMGHIYHAICSLMMLAENMIMYPENNDLCPPAYSNPDIMQRIKEHRHNAKRAALNVINEFRNKK